MAWLRAHHKSVEPQFSDDALLDELREVWRLAGTERLSVAQYRAHGGLHSVSTYLARFGSWAMATSLAAQEPSVMEQKGKWKKRTCLRCGRLFGSDGPHMRLCGACRDRINADSTPEPIRPLQTGWHATGGPFRGRGRAVNHPTDKSGGLKGESLESPG